MRSRSTCVYLAVFEILRRQKPSNIKFLQGYIYLAMLVCVLVKKQHLVNSHIDYIINVVVTQDGCRNKMAD